MPLGGFEKAILRLLAENRSPDSFVGGATVLLQADDTHRRSQDIDLFHDTAESIHRCAERDRACLREHHYIVQTPSVQETFERSIVTKDGSLTKIEWVFDSAFRFFPVERDPEVGYRLSYWDAATNKVLALAGRGELRDYLDVLYIDRHKLSLGALCWAASGKDLGYTPNFIVEEAQRLARYPKTALEKLKLVTPVDLVEAKRQWLDAARAALSLFAQLPAEELGCLYLNEKNVPVTPDPASSDFPKLRRHFGSVRGAWPVIRE